MLDEETRHPAVIGGYQDFSIRQLVIFDFLTVEQQADNATSAYLGIWNGTV
jgi:hypothetical protein